MTVLQDTSRMTAGSIDKLVQESLDYISLYLTLGMPPAAIAAVKTAMTYAKQVGREKEVQAEIKQIEANYNQGAIEAHRIAVIGQKMVQITLSIFPNHLNQ